MKIIYDARRDTEGPVVFAFQEGPGSGTDALTLVGRLLYWNNKVDDLWVSEGYEQYKVQETLEELAKEQNERSF